MIILTMRREAEREYYLVGGGVGGRRSAAATMVLWNFLSLLSRALASLSLTDRRMG